ncbi:MAG: hypothetical protein HKM07_02840 [Chlamydiae bacterium]|nr:hypothetical protein [Chlamydiota bacterium]
MKKTLFLLIVFSTSCIQTCEPNDLSRFSEISKERVDSSLEVDEKIHTILHKISKGAVYVGTGTIFGSAFVLARLGWGICQISPWASKVGKECLFLSNLCGSVAHHVFAQIGKGPSPSFFKGIPPSQFSWHINEAILSRIPAVSEEQSQLLSFLQKRWLAKSTGFFPSVVDWICPIFDTRLQVHPQSANAYARSPWIKLSNAYKNRMNAWKQDLPHPPHYPLILTRPFDLQDYLPSFLGIAENERVQTTVKKIALRVQTDPSKVVVDLTQVFKGDRQDSEKWLQTWNTYQAAFMEACKEYNINIDQILCIERMKQEEIGGIRLLPFTATSSEKIEEQYQFLLQWISVFGLSANRIELDRWPSSPNIITLEHGHSPIQVKLESKDEFVSDLHAFEQNWRSNQPEKTLLLKGTLDVLKGLFSSLSEEKWNEIITCPTRSSVTKISLMKIKEELQHLKEKGSEDPFFTMASHIEEIHASLCALLEIFSPFTFGDFPSIYQNLLHCIPSDLKPLASYGIHSSAMTSIAGIFNATEKAIGKKPRVLYGKNTYYECINAAKLVSSASSIKDATEKDWEEVDLILAQFNPVWRGTEFQIDAYSVENVSEVLHTSLSTRQGMPLILALDCTLDFIDSPRVGQLLTEFREEIQSGALNIICYKSGIKFDLFGMDNYCGAPFYMIHNQDTKWSSFTSLLTDPALQNDRLSLNWFCLAYQYAASELELYQKQIFANTRALLNKISSRLLNYKESGYRVVPIKEEADPSFIDVKISGPLHQIRGSALAAGGIYLQCMEGKHPIFYRLSLGFYHPNFTMLFSEECTTIRLTLGLDPSQVDLLARCFERIDALNDTSEQTLLEAVLQNVSVSSLTPSELPLQAYYPSF